MDNDFRSWGLDGSAFPAADNRNHCDVGETCRIWDWSLAASDTTIRGILDPPTGDDGIIHTWSTLLDTECAEIPADWDGAACTTTFLPATVELMDDGIGNDNLLCEAAEACLYLPNIGAYQGHGDLVSEPFTDGVITGVTLWKYAQNGR